MTPLTPAPTAPLAPPPGWYPDPWVPGAGRWWDGGAWTGYATAPPITSTLPAVEVPKPPVSAPPGSGVIAIVGFVAAFALSTLGYALASQAGLDSDSLGALLAGQVGFWIGIVGSCVLAVRRRGSGHLSDIGWDGVRADRVGLGAAFGVAAKVASIQIAAVVALVLVVLFGEDEPTRVTGPLEEVTANSLTFWVVALLVVIGAPITEELFFRGLVQGALTRRFGTIAGIAVQAILFGFAHYQVGMGLVTAVTTIVAITVIGAALGWLRVLTRSLDGCMVAHAVGNLIAIVFILAIAN